MRPRIGMISTWAFQDELTAAVDRANGIPVIFPINVDRALAKVYMDLVDGLLVPGGEDVTPFLYGQDPRVEVVLSRQDKDLFEMALIQEAMAQNKPIFGICRGLQILNVAMGGTLIQDIPAQVEHSICHRQASETPQELLHRVKIVENSGLSRILGVEELDVNSLHHQCIDRLAQGLIVTATTQDKVIEGIESSNGRILAVQWHPECLYTRYPHFLALFAHFVALCSSSNQS